MGLKLIYIWDDETTSLMRFFYFYIFYFRFLQKYIFDLEIYRNIPGRPVSAKKEENKLQIGPWGRSPGCGAAGPPPLYKVLAAPYPPFGLLKIQKKRKEREGGRGRVRERQSGEVLSDFQAGDFK